MSKIWEPQPKDVLEHWVDSILEGALDKLTKWEEDFVRSCDEQLVYKDHLSERQEEILERIYAEKTE